MRQVPSRRTRITSPIYSQERGAPETVADYERWIYSRPLDVFGLRWTGDALETDVTVPRVGDSSLAYQPPPLLSLQVRDDRMRTNAVDLQLYAAAFNRYCTVVAAHVECRSSDVNLFSDWLIRGTPTSCGLCIADTHGGRFYYPVQAKDLGDVSHCPADVLIAFEPFVAPTDYAVVHLADWTGTNYDEVRLSLEADGLRELIGKEIERPTLEEDAAGRAEAIARLRDASPSDSLLERIRGWLFNKERRASE